MIPLSWPLLEPRVSFLQGEFDRAKPEHHQVPQGATSAPTSQDHQKGAQAQGCVRLRRQFPQECVQHPHCLHTVSGEFNYYLLQ